MKDIEIEIAKLDQEIIDLDKKATEAYKLKDLKTEDKFQAEIDLRNPKLQELRKKLYDNYEKIYRMDKGILEKYEGKSITMAVFGKVCQVTTPLIREISLEKTHEGKKFAYLKLDSTDGFTGKIEQTKMYWNKYVVQEVIERLSKILKELD